jgi:hypothetical protein
MVITDISKKIGQEWSQMIEEQKKVWKDKAKELKVDYEVKNIEYNEQKR